MQHGWLRLTGLKHAEPNWLRACGASFCVHLLSMLLLGFLWSAEPAGSQGDSPIVTLRVERSAADYFEDEQEPGVAAMASTAEAEENSAPSAGASAAATSDFLADAPPTDPTSVLPSRGDWAGLVDSVGSGAEGAGGQGLLSAAAGSRTPTRGTAETTVFGVSGKGFKFVYVFDRSGSMGGLENSPLNAAKAELKQSLGDLRDTHQFQIIFYNERPTVFPIAGQSGRLVWGTSANKARALRFIDGIIADGSTRHEDALLAALGLAPDVIFFLTDADQPVLTSPQLEKIRARNRGGVTINTIEFGLGPSLSEENFLVRLARENGGEHTYFDTSRLARGR